MSKNNKLIGIHGMKRSGKDTVAKLINEILKEKDLKTYQTVAFGTKVKQCAEILTGIPADQWETDEQKDTELGPEWTVFDDLGMKIPMTRRRFMQKLGTDAVTTSLHPNAWINSVFMDYSPSDSDKPSRWIVTDVRFPLEANAVTSREGYLIRVERPETDNHGDGHASENALKGFTGFDHSIINSGTLEELKDKVKAVLFSMKLI